jgi:hypothetical protein
MTQWRIWINFKKRTWKSIFIKEHKNRFSEKMRKMERLQILVTTELHNEAHWRLKTEMCIWSCFSQIFSKEEIVVPMIGCIMLNQLNVSSATCWVGCLTPSRTSCLALTARQDRCSGTTCWTWCPNLSKKSYVLAEDDQLILYVESFWIGYIARLEELLVD